MSIREEQCNKVCRILDDVLANRTTERDSLIVAVRKAFESLEQFGLSEQLPSAQFKRINKEIHEITESDKISYSTICDKFPIPQVYFNTYAEAEHWARFNQPNNRPYYIIERSEHFEIVGEVR